MGNFIPSDYELVQDRISRFQKSHPNGRMTVEPIPELCSEERCFCVARVWKDADQPEPDGVDIACDWKGKDRGATQTNWVETASTSALGRALALVIGWKGKGRPSQQEMEIAQSRQSAPHTPMPQPPSAPIIPGFVEGDLPPVESTPIDGGTGSSEQIRKVADHLQGAGILGEVVQKPLGYDDVQWPPIERNPQGSSASASTKQIGAIDKYIRISGGHSPQCFDWFVKEVYGVDYPEISKAQASAIMDAFFGKKK